MIDRGALRRSTILWIASVTWVVWSYLIQDPAPDPWSAVTRNAFTLVASVLIPAVSVLIAVAWVRTLRA